MNQELKLGQILSIHGYKHNGDLYRTWDKSYVLEINSDYIALVNENVTITELNGRQWNTYDPAIWLFFKNEWFNIICMIRDSGIHYYCNIASPFLYDTQVVKYIDYDLDIKVFPDRSYRLLDLMEFKKNCHLWNYKPSLQRIIWKKFNFLKKSVRQKQEPKIVFNDELIYRLWCKFKVIKNSKTLPS